MREITVTLDRAGSQLVVRADSDYLDTRWRLEWEATLVGGDVEDLTRLLHGFARAIDVDAESTLLGPVGVVDVDGKGRLTLDMQACTLFDQEEMVGIWARACEVASRVVGALDVWR